MRTMTVIAGLLVSLLFVPAAAVHAAQPITVEGTFVAPVPCVPLAANPSTGQLSCEGSSTWAGSLTGQTIYRVTGTFDAVTGAGQGTISETFYGRLADARTGTIAFSEAFTMTPTGLPDTGAMHLIANVIGGAGAFAGASGSLVFDGIVNGTSDEGGYEGTLALPSR